MSELRERQIEVNGSSFRVWEKGEGAPIGYLPGYGGLQRWTPFLDKLAERRRVVAPSLPGFPGGERAHLELDSYFDWVLATHDILDAAGLGGADLMAVSFSGTLAADVAGLWPDKVRRLALLAPFGIFDAAEPTRDLWALQPAEPPQVLVADPDRFTALHALPNDADPIEWQIEQVRASEAAARYLWPLGDTRLEKRLHRISQPTLLLWGAEDQVMPRSYAERFAAGIAGQTRIEAVAGAGHLADLDAPEAVAGIVLDFMVA